MLRPCRREGGVAWTKPARTRHTAASLAVAAGANVKAVQQMLGHASAAMTLEVYAGLLRTISMRLRTQLDRAFTCVDGQKTTNRL